MLRYKITHKTTKDTVEATLTINRLWSSSDEYYVFDQPMINSYVGLLYPCNDSAYLIEAIND